MRRFGAELVHQDARAGVAGDVFEEQRRAAGPRLAVATQLGRAVGDLGHFEVGGDGLFDAAKFTGLVDASDPFAKVFVRHFPAPSAIGMRQQVYRTTLEGPHS